jgi:hypothetical protein
MPSGGADSTPRYVLIWDAWLKDTQWAGGGEEVLASRPALDGHRLLLLKIDANRFEPSRTRH